MSRRVVEALELAVSTETRRRGDEPMDDEYVGLIRRVEGLEEALREVAGWNAMRAHRHGNVGVREYAVRVLRGQARLGGTESEEVDALVREITRIREAGNLLAEAAHRMSADRDGVHRLRLALAGWYEALADEWGRGEKDDPTP